MGILARAAVAAGLLALAACGGGSGGDMDEGLEIEVPVRSGGSSERSEDE